MYTLSVHIACLYSISLFLYLNCDTFFKYLKGYLSHGYDIVSWSKQTSICLLQNMLRSTHQCQYRTILGVIGAFHFKYVTLKKYHIINIYVKWSLKWNMKLSCSTNISEISIELIIWRAQITSLFWVNEYYSTKAPLVYLWSYSRNVKKLVSGEWLLRIRTGFQTKMNISLGMQYRNFLRGTEFLVQNFLLNSIKKLLLN